MSSFQSIFKIKSVPILPPLIDETTRNEIKQIREIVRAKELKFAQRKEEKDRENIAKQSALAECEPNLERRGSYTLTSPIFESSLLPKISIESSESDGETVVDGPLSLLSEIDDNATEKITKDLRNEIDKQSRPASSLFEAVIQPTVNNELKQLKEQQKQEYLKSMEALKNKFTREQQALLMNLQVDLPPVTSTPLSNSFLTTTDDEDFAAFKTCLQSQSQSLEEKTIVNEHEAKIKASIIINSHVRGYLTRRLLKTIYVQEHVRHIRETLQLVLNLDDHDIGGSPVQNILMKAKLFRQLQSDLYNFNEIFFQQPVKEQMRIIAADRILRLKKQLEGNNERLSLSFTDFV